MEGQCLHFQVWALPQSTTYISQVQYIPTPRITFSQNLEVISSLYFGFQCCCLEYSVILIVFLLKVNFFFWDLIACLFLVFLNEVSHHENTSAHIGLDNGCALLVMSFIPGEFPCNFSLICFTSLLPLSFFSETPPSWLWET